MTLKTIAEERNLPLHRAMVGEEPTFRLGRNVTIGPEVRHDSRWTASCEPALVVETTCDQAGGALLIRRSIRNTSDRPFPPLDEIAPLNLGFEHPAAGWELLCARGGTSEHYWPPLAYEVRHISQVRSFAVGSHPAGRSSNQDLPLLVGAAGDLHAGFFCGLEWSAHWRWSFFGDAQRSWLIGSVPVRGLVLEPGETLELPAVHLGLFRGDLSDGANALRRYLYEHVCPEYAGSRALPMVSYDSWFGMENDYTSEIMYRQVDRAAELGVEVFAHDAAWFPGGFPHGVGNWQTTDPQKWPEGLEGLAEYVRSRGMAFGLWFEIERAAPGTAAVRDHPELFIEADAPGFGGIGGRQHHLNLARRDAQDWAIETISHWIGRLDLRWSRWDYNIEPHEYWHSADPTGKVQFACMRGLYHVLDTLMARHPKWRVEACASGGRRIDIGTLRRAHTVWFSDETVNPASCRWMQARANRLLPGHLLNSSVPVNLGQGDAGFDETAILSRMLGKLSFDGDIASWSPALTRRGADMVKTFKRLRPLFVQDFHQLLPIPRQPTDADAAQFASWDGAEHAVFAFAGIESAQLTLKLRGLATGTVYRAETLVGGEAAHLCGDTLTANVPAGEGQLWLISRDGQGIGSITPVSFL